jgi:hypothetical protein
MMALMAQVSEVAPVLDREAAQTFLEHLDPDTNEFTFQTFTDSEEGRRSFPVDQRTKGRFDPLAKTLHGTLAKHWTTLTDLSLRGAGVFVCINKTNLRGRRTENVILVRAFFVDFDGLPVEAIKKKIAHLGLIPHVVVQTRADSDRIYS